MHACILYFSPSDCTKHEKYKPECCPRKLASLNRTVARNWKFKYMTGLQIGNEKFSWQNFKYQGLDVIHLSGGSTLSSDTVFGVSLMFTVFVAQSCVLYQISAIRIIFSLLCEHNYRFIRS